MLVYNYLQVYCFINRRLKSERYIDFIYGSVRSNNEHETEDLRSVIEAARSVQSVFGHQSLKST